MFSDKKGVAMLIVISLILMLLILGGAVLMISTGHFSTSYHQIKRARAYYAAEAAMQHALWKCRTGGYNLGAIPSGGFVPDPPDSIPLADFVGMKGIDIKIYELGSDPLGTGFPAPPGTYPVIVTVDY